MSTSRDDFGIAIRSALLQRGARQKFSLFVLILLSIFIFILDNLNLKPIKVVRSLINDGVYRVAAVSSSPIKLSTATKDFYVKHIFVYKENETMRAELNELKKKEFESLYLQTENKKLQDIFELEKKSEFKTVAAKVMIDKNSPYLNSVILNKGSGNGIKLGMPVLSEGNLAGRIVEVNYMSSRILLLNDLNSRIPVTLEEGAQAILSGSSFKNPVLEYLPDDYELIEGINIFASGKDGIFAAGTPIGVTNDKKEVNLFVDPNQLSFVTVNLVKQNKENF